MLAKKNISPGFLIAAAAGFLLLWGTEGMLESQISSGQILTGTAFGKYLSQKISAIGTSGALALVAQLKFRWLVLCLLAYWLSLSSAGTFPASNNRLRWRVRLFFVIQLLYLPGLLSELNIRWRWSAFFEPPLLPGFFIDSFPSMAIIQFCGIFLFGISAWLVLAKWKNDRLLPAAMACLTWLGWTFLLSLYQSGGVTDHAYASMHSGMFFMIPFLLLWRKNPGDAALGHRIFQSGIWGCYFFSGLEKLFLSGPGWLNPENFSLLCRTHPGPACEWFAAHPAAAGFAFAFVLLFQLLSPLQWHFPRWAYFTTVSGLLFHIGTWLILGVGGWQSPWLAMLVFLLPLGEENNPSGEPAIKAPAR